ncbi:TetR/AcrR family transcriptional regulator [Streptomyces sp. 769]|uniref:TetR/AcrR family transcriptional regulator n=1 Tax=Streptomyces sp. 769 TaxID=1262452 RepID=UPI00057CE4E7|nr:TetR/AcrR family transcriptional regulator [Streptomyces sp. 769]
MAAEHIDGRQLRYQHRRPELLDDVAAYVLEHGLADLAMRPLATAVGVNHGTLLHHFGSKENLVTEVIQRLRTRMADAVDVTSSPNSTGNLAYWWQRSTASQHLPVYRLLFEVYAQAVRQPERYGHYLQQVVHESLKLMESLVEAEGCPPARATLVASVIVAQARGLQLDLLATGDRERVDRSFALFLDMLTMLKHTWHQ